MSRGVVLITGSSRGMGAAYARHLARTGFTVAIHDISKTACSVYEEVESVDSLLEELRKLKSNSRFYEGDLTKESSARTLVQDVLSDYGRIDALVNNVGGDIAGHDENAAGGKPPENHAFARSSDFFAIYDRNFLSCLHMCRAIGPYMVEQGRGKILNVSSVSAGIGVARETAYAVAKAGVVHLTRCLATQLRPNGINVNCLAPGPTMTGRFVATLRDRTPEDRQRFEGKGRLERIGQPEDICKVVEFFLSELSDFVSGQVLRVDGGQFTTPI